MIELIGMAVVAAIVLGVGLGAARMARHAHPSGHTLGAEKFE